ncbi:MAG TPA: HemK/PrmC family methyltransferase, partial [Edaphobacter sp.]|nr:HemK/PrmC family methyltransferase [Edaphobacter sp.]
MTLQQSLSQAVSALAANPLLREQAQRDAELLLLDVVGIDRATLLAHPQRELTEEQAGRYKAAIARRLKNEPVQYITGRQEFFGLDLKVTPATLIPRPETEHLVEAVLERMPRSEAITILDIGTGTGAIAIALAAHLPLAEIVATDISGEALRVAEWNAHAHKLGERIRFIQSDLLGG